MYCGNNEQHPDLTSRKLQLGNRYGCLRKGIGRGLNLPMDSNYLGPYSPIDQRKIYCGQEEILPDDYDLMGNLPQCLQKGIGIGKRHKALSQGLPRHTIRKIIIMTTIYIVLVGGVFSALYFLKPSWITDIDDQGSVKINKRKFALIYGGICLLLLIILFMGIWWYQSK